ncbi:acetolactate synthase-1/2/3 large subunit [Allocatelliglobosispora scoriae]|uniref:Acetolactate synthase-1/2/3 large subunit n=1 Tax=Allocatelliglobosispora scoriae TaxID=643052 RepID=A0A841C041_9ACTN|nr:thiamine pyrophosphate-binding protein [Allocatelliglobosispora scoriae]MBB5872513.1 acetolactate synthase-1/2/3 large subunit [Allocatelliglobosispora scoriae]
MTLRTGGEVLVRSLVRHGVTTIFGIPGSHNLEIYRHLAAHGIQHITPRHEQGAGYAADGYARTSGRPGIALVTSGPAALNAAAALGQSYSDSIPTLLIAPGMPRNHAHHGLLHETRDQRAVFAGIVGELAYRVHHHGELTEVIAEIFAGFTSGRPRPAYLEIPLDLLSLAADTRIVDPLRVSRPQPDPGQVVEAARLLARAQRPGLLVGGGAKEAFHEVKTLAEHLRAGVLTTTNGKGILSEEHPLSLGAALHLPAATDWLSTRDVLLIAGSELAPTDFWNGPPTWPPTVIRIDIDPAQLLVNARPTLAVCADARPALAGVRQLLQASSEAPLAHVGSPPPGAQHREELKRQRQEEGARWLPWLDALAKATPRNTIVTADNAMAGYYGALGNLPSHEPGSFAFPTGFGTLGYALPAAIGAKAAQPDRPVVALSGDGGLMFSCQEIATAASAGLSLPVVVFVNGGYGEIRAEMAEAGIGPIAVDLPVPDFAALAVALGGRGVDIATPDELGPAIAGALAHPGPTLLMVVE